MDYRDNLQVDIKAMIYSVCAKWRTMLICAVLFAVLVGAFGYYRSATMIDTATGDVETQSEIADFKALRKDISKEDRALVEKSATQYLDYLREYNDLTNYGDASILMKIDAHNVPKMVSLYAIDDGSSDIVVKDLDEATESSLKINGGVKLFLTDADNIIDIYKRELINETTVAEIKNALGEQLGTNSVNELINVEVEGTSLLAVTTIGNDEDMCRKMMDVLAGHIDAAGQKVAEAYEYKITPVNSYYVVEDDRSIMSLQRDHYNYLVSLKNTMNSLGSTYSAESKDYYDALIKLANNMVLNQKVDKSVSLMDAAAASGQTDSTEIPEGIEVVRSISLKFIVLGFALGIFASAFWFVVKYILSGCLHTADDLREAFKVSVIGELKGDKKGSGSVIDKKLDAMFNGARAESYDDQLDLICSGIAISADKTGASTIMLIGAANDQNSVAVRSQIKDGVTGKNSALKVGVGESVLISSDSMERLAASDAVVLVESKGKSEYDDIARELELCEKYGVKVLGAVVV